MDGAGFPLSDPSLDPLRRTDHPICRWLVQAENIAFGKPDATRAEIEKAAKAANAHGFISQFNGGYDYNVGTKGKKVSSPRSPRFS